ncbi:MAG: tryptophanase [Candidatus Riflebacteria bacterium]|nr:tryptophanase [Candidatus Riflebacteria bacterium]
MDFKTVIEPFRIKSIETIKFTTRSQRILAIEAAGYNLFQVKAEDVLIDLLSDSGTGAMSTEQWAGMMRGDESYAGAKSFYRFEESVREVTGYKHILPAHQGRAAERTLFKCTINHGDIVPNNTNFTTTRGQIELRGAKAFDLPISEGTKPSVIHPFKGNIDLEKLRKLLSGNRSKVPLVMVTITNNSLGGQPVSMANIRSTREICREFNVPLFLDACRFAENAWFIKMREEGYSDKSPSEIAKEFFSYCDGCTMSAKKDGMVNIGGFIALNDDQLAVKCKNELIINEGFPTYGGLAGYDLEALAVGIKEALDEDYLRYRIKSMAYFGEKLISAGIPIVQPTGGHGIFIDAGKMMSHLPAEEYPAFSLALALYIEGGVRSIGSCTQFSKGHDSYGHAPELELVRLAFPRRVYTQSHVDYLSEVIIYVNLIRKQIAGMKIQPGYEHPGILAGRFEPIGGKLIRD